MKLTSLLALAALLAGTALGAAWLRKRVFTIRPFP